MEMVELSEREDIPDPADGRKVRRRTKSRPKPDRLLRNSVRSALKQSSQRKSLLNARLASHGDNARQKRQVAQEFCEQYLFDLSVQHTLTQDYLANELIARKLESHRAPYAAAAASRKNKARLNYEQLL